MKLSRLFLSILSLAAAASAQCFESDFGTLLGGGDDVCYPSINTVLPMNISFPMGGTAASYTTIQVNTNGACFLSNGAAAVGVTATGFSTSVSTLVNTFRGVAGATQAPRIAAYWRDLDLLPANNGGLWLNNSLPGKCVITWQNAQSFAQPASSIFTFQAQLFASGEVRFYYDSSAQNSSTVVLCGVSQGAAIADPGSTVLSAGATGISSSKIVYQAFTSINSFDLAATGVLFQPNAGGGYDVLPGSCIPATNEGYGAGCNLTSATFYELFGTFDLSNNTLRLQPDGNGGYTAGHGTPTAFVHTSPGLALTDDSIGALALPSAFAYPGGSTTTLLICSNGYIWMQPSGLTFPTPTVAELFARPARLCPLWCDLAPDGATNLHNVFAQVDTPNNKAYVTWFDVPTRLGGSVSMQVEFDLGTGAINITWPSVVMPANTTFESLVGWTPGSGVSTIDVGSRDISATLPFGTAGTESLPLTLSAAPIPSFGSTVVYTTSNIPLTAVLTADIISLIRIPAGVAIQGAPDCLRYVDLGLSSTALMFGSPTATLSFFVPNNPGLTGLPLCVQSASLVPGINPLNVITSNGMLSTIR